MKKSVSVITFVLIGVLFLSISFVSANAFTDFFKNLFNGGDNSGLKGSLATEPPTSGGGGGGGNLSGAFCTDSDGGKNYTVKGTTYGPYVNNTDYCNGNIIQENYCLNNNQVMAADTCPNGCSNGACIQSNVTVSCTDSDGGEDYFIKGTRINNNPAYADYGLKEEDYCIQNPSVSNGVVINDESKKVNSCAGDNCYVIEYHCKEDLSDAHIGYNCPNGCSNGACISTSNQCNLITESISPFKFEKIVNPSSSGEGWVEKEAYYSDPATGSWVMVQITDFDDPQIVKNFIDGHDSNENYKRVLIGEDTVFYMGPTLPYYDWVVGNNRIIETQWISFPSDIDVKNLPDTYPLAKIYLQNCQSSLSGGSPCSDSDGGKNYYEKGYLKNNIGVNFEDYCLNSSDLIERYCSEDPSIFTLQYSCPDGCLDGICVKGTCQDLISKVANPKDFEDYGISYTLSWNNTQKYNRYIKDREYLVTNYGAGWYAYENNENYYINYNLDVFDDNSTVDLSGWLEERTGYSVCKAQSYWSADGKENKIYICNWDVLGNNQNLDNYQYKSREVLWTQDNIIVELYLYTGKYLTDEETIKLGQKKISDFLSDLQNNQGKYIGWEYLGLDWPLSRQVELSLAQCPSQISPGTCEASWNCKLEPVICPPHGFQKKTCVDYNCGGNREEQVYCSPGMCSGCIIPRWFQGSDNVCMPYGFRFDQEVSTHKELVEYNQTDKLGESDSTQDYSLVIESSEKAVLTLYDKTGVSYSYDLIPGGSVKIEIPDWETNIKSFIIKTNSIHVAAYEGDKGYVDMTITSEQWQSVMDTINAYCHYDGEVKMQKNNEEKCQNSYECISNICTNGKCYGLAETLQTQMDLLKQQTKLLEEQNGLLKRIWCKITTMLGKNPTTNYAKCLAAGTNVTVTAPATATSTVKATTTTATAKTSTVKK